MDGFHRQRVLARAPPDIPDGGTYHKQEWPRIVGDMVFLFAGALHITLGTLRSVWKRDLSPTA
jgi:hypothetical protein